LIERPAGRPLAVQVSGDVSPTATGLAEYGEFTSPPGSDVEAISRIGSDNGTEVDKWFVVSVAVRVMVLGTDVGVPLIAPVLGLIVRPVPANPLADHVTGALAPTVVGAGTVYGVSIAPGGSVGGVMPSTLSGRVTCRTFPQTSTAVTATSYVPPAVGVPLTVPSDVPSEIAFSPGGLPLFITQMTGGNMPALASGAEYVEPTAPGASEVVVMLQGWLTGDGGEGLMQFPLLPASAEAGRTTAPIRHTTATIATRASERLPTPCRYILNHPLKFKYLVTRRSGASSTSSLRSSCQRLPAPQHSRRRPLAREPETLA
jgi:hypothetical protein